jgi:predicted deacylase
MSNATLTVGSLSARTGEKTFGVNEITVQGQPYRLHMWLVNGVKEGPTLLVTAGVHAAEYASIAAALDLGRTLDPQVLAGRVVVIPVLNVAGFGVRSIYISPLDGKNLTRVFPGDERGTASEQVADWVFRNAMTGCDYYIDLHGGDLIEALVPFTIMFRSGNERIDAESFEIAKAFGIRYLVRSETPGSAYAAATKAGIPSILAEAGGQGIWPPADVARLRSGVDRVMRHLRMVPGPEPETASYTLLDRFLWLRSEHDGFWYPSIAVGDAVKEGQELGRVTDHEGLVLQSATSPAAGRVLFLVTSLAINKGDPFLAVGA